MVPETEDDIVRGKTPAEMKLQIKEILAGNFDPRTLADVPSKVIRMFVACTATDMIQERNILVEKVYPRLREYTREKHGLEFQVVDIRWGIEDTSWDDHSEVELLLKQLRQCQNMSAGPNFLALIGQRYGKRHLPAEIPAHEYELIRMTLKMHRNRETREAPILDKWYNKDTNAVPPVYVLQPISVRIPNYYAEDDNLRQQAQEEWEEARTSMRTLLQKGAEFCLMERTIDAETKHKYVMSELECLVQEGIQFAENPVRNSLVFLRTIADLKNYVDHPKTPTFMEVMYNDKIDKIEIEPESKRLLEHLTKDIIPHYVPKDQILESSILWRFDNGIHPVLHKPYLNEFAERMYGALVEIIDRSISPDLEWHFPPIYDEVLRHWLLTKQRCEHFHGREDVLQRIKGYMLSSSSQPLVISGVSGSGKTSVMAYVQSQLPGWLMDEVIVIVRYLGLTTDSADIRQVINSICHQMAIVCDDDLTKIPTDYKGLLNYFYEKLNSVPEDKHVVIFLDSLDQLQAEYNAHYMQWLPPKLKPNVKMVLSTLPEKHNILTRLKTEIIHNSANFIDVGPLGPEKCFELLNSWLEESSRTLTSQQQSILDGAFQKCSLPLYARLLFDEVLSWRSYSVVDGSKLGADCPSYINNLFDHLEMKYGKTLVSRALAYVTASHTGLSDCEIEDLLSLDDTVLDEVYSTWHPPVRRIPPLLWLRIRKDLGAFLKTTEADGYTVYFWYHRQFIDIARYRYLSNDDLIKEVHKHIADYYLGTWHGKQIPFTYTNNVTSLLKLKSSYNKADRLVPSQPLTFQPDDNTTRYNRRKYDQVPRHLFLSGRLEELNKLVLFSYEWLYNKIKVLSLQHIIADFSLNPGVEATLVEDALRGAQSIIATNVNNMAAELTGRLLMYYPTHPNIQQLIDQCDTIGLQHCALIPTYPYHAVPGSPLQHKLECQEPVQFLHMIEDSRYIFTKRQSSPYVKQFDLATGEFQRETHITTGDMYVTPDGRHFLIVDDTAEKSMKIHDSSSGKFLGQLIPMNHIQLLPKEKYRLGPIGVSDDHVCMIVTTESSYLCIASVLQRRFLEIVGLDGKCNMCKMSPDAKYIFCNSNKNLLSYELDTLQHISNVPLDFTPSQMIFVNNGSRAFVLSKNENKILVIHLRDGFADLSYKINLEELMPHDRIQDISLSYSQDILLIRGMNNILLYDVLKEGIVQRFARPNDIPKEFKLPRKQIRDIIFTQAKFSNDDEYLICTIFRNIYIWRVSDGTEVKSLTAPVGIITDLLISTSRSQIISHLEDSDVIQVWNLADALSDVGTLDRLTSRILEMTPTADNSIAYIRCQKSDEIGVIDMSSGQLLDLLTHETEVTDLTVTYDGSHAFVSVKREKYVQNLNKIWNMEERKMVHEFGEVTGHSVAMNTSKAIIHVCQQENYFNAPYHISQFKFEDDRVDEVACDFVLNHVLAKPFITKDDKYLIVLTAEEYHKSNAHYFNPTICSFSLDSNFSFASFGPSEFQDFFNNREMVDVRPFENNPYAVIALFVSEDNHNFVNGICNGDTSLKHIGNGFTESSDKRVSPSSYGFFILDVCSGAVTHVCDKFMSNTVPLRDLMFSKDATICLDSHSNVYDLQTGEFVKQALPNGIRPQKLINAGKALVYFDGSEVFVQRYVDGKVVARCDVHTDIACIDVCKDDRTLLIGCVDGTVASYVFIDEKYDSTSTILSTVLSRARVKTLADVNDGRLSRSWDRVELGSLPPPTRPTSAALSLGPTDKDKLKQIRHVAKFRPKSDTVLYLNARSKSCAIM